MTGYQAAFRPTKTKTKMRNTLVSLGMLSGQNVWVDIEIATGAVNGVHEWLLPYFREGYITDVLSARLAFNHMYAETKAEWARLAAEEVAQRAARPAGAGVFFARRRRCGG